MNEKLRQAVLAVLNENCDDVNAVINNIARHGTDWGVPGFTMYHETVDFFTVNRMEIVSLVKKEAKDIGVDAVTFVSRLESVDEDPDTKNAIAEVLFNSGESRETDDDTWNSIANALAWYALEEVAYELNTD